MMSCKQLSPLYPPDVSGQALKGRIGVYLSWTKLGTNTSLRGLGVNN